jgi:ATP-dependent Clp protease ATP-binding subunit ClpA
MGGNQVLLDPTQNSPEVRDFEKALLERVVGQDRAVRRLARVYQVYMAGLSTPGRPLVNLLFLGPTGSGKTRLVEAAAEVLMGDSKAVIKVDCAEFHHSHEVAKLIGSPPGYVGHRETQPLITQEVLERHYSDRVKLSLVLFDEIEKASDSLWQLLLGILDKASLTLGDNRRVDFSRTMIFLTSNLGSQEVMRLMRGGLGFSPVQDNHEQELDQKIYQTAMEASRRKFSPEFMNRIDKVIVFRLLNRDSLEKILDIELGRVQDRIMAATEGNPFVFICTPAARDFLLQEGTDQKFGARHLKRAIERYLVFPISNLLATHQIKLGDLITVDRSPDGSKLAFIKEEQGALVKSPNDAPAETFEAAISADATSASQPSPGKQVETVTAGKGD